VSFSLELLEQFGIEGVGWALALEEGGDVLGGGERHPAAGFGGSGAEMRSEDDIGAFETDVDERFLFEDVEASTGDFAGFEGVDECGFVDNRAAGSVNEEGGRLHAKEFGRVEESASIAVKRNMQ